MSIKKTKLVTATLGVTLEIDSCCDVELLVPIEATEKDILKLAIKKAIKDNAVFSFETGNDGWIDAEFPMATMQRERKDEIHLNGVYESDEAIAETIAAKAIAAA
jgi:hypothetical protein